MNKKYTWRGWLYDESFNNIIEFFGNSKYDIRQQYLNYLKEHPEMNGKTLMIKDCRELPSVMTIPYIFTEGTIMNGDPNKFRYGNVEIPLNYYRPI